MDTKIITRNFWRERINISKKEKNLLILLLVVILYWLFYKFAFSTQADKLAELKQEKDSYNNELFKIDNILTRDKTITDKWNQLSSDIKDITEKHFSTIYQPEIMYTLNQIIDHNKLSIPGVYFSEPDNAMLNGIETRYLVITIPFEGNYGDLGTFLSHIRTSPKRFLVNQISLSKNDDGTINGQISLNTYSYDGIIESNRDSSYNAEVQKVIKEDPFKPYDGYKEKSEEDINSTEGINIETEKGIILENFEGGDLYFMASSPSVTGKVSKFKNSKEGKYSLRTEYFISTDNKEERAYVALDDKDIVIKYPPFSIGIWAHSYGYSPVALGLRFHDQEGKEVDLELARGVNWMGWEYIEAKAPQDIKLYPLKLDRIYLELGANRDDYGVMLFDNIELTYPPKENEGEKIDKAYIFYVVEYGDTLESISEKFYGAKSKYSTIMKQNGLDINSVLEAGQILVIPK